MKQVVGQWCFVHPFGSFHRLRSVAPLKPEDVQIDGIVLGRFPPAQVGGPIEALGRPGTP